MVEFDPGYVPKGHSVTARFSLQPSDALKEAIEPLYRPSVAKQRLSHTALRSSIGVPLDLLPGGQFVYHDPSHPDRNAIQEYEKYSRDHVRPVVGHQLPQLAFLNILRNREGALRLQLRFGLNPVDRVHIAWLSQFRTIASTGMLDTQLDLRSSEVMQNDVILRDAIGSLRSVLGINHPARSGQPQNRQYVGGGYHATINNEQLSFRIGEV